MEKALLDLSQLESFIMVGLDDYHEILNDLIEELPKNFKEIHAAMSREDLPKIQSMVHSLRGMLSVFGCVQMSERLSEFENPDFHPSASEADRIHSELVASWEQHLAALLEWEKTVPEFNV